MKFFDFLKPKVALILHKKKVGLALGGGAARGLCHIGVIKVLEKHKVPIDFIAGTSMGALIGAVYAAGISVEEMERLAANTGWGKLLQLTLHAHGTFSGKGFFRFVENRIGKDKFFSDLKIPLRIVTTDLKSGKPFIFDDGLVATAVQASTTFPGAFVPLAHRGKLLVDGGIVNNVPTSVVREMGANFVIAVDAVPDFEMVEDPKNVLQVVGRTVDLLLKKVSEEGRQTADVLIQPEFDEDMWHLDLHKAKHLIQEGETAANKMIDEIVHRLHIKE
ncbi:MAG: patatin-like phospholipase family protein [Candidatus Margulisbacteria bacterium]|nr:patatin-like phospholipase family protein [Candidatus Margulisiibacteriota bacterium]MBU1022070.1 patatin-like phospholipase family protein [Candidatus Margulisiibacteriota bacterium]MBU1729665.1 patatin-like phospholipase family protein [Candidatus Margulisiibacteriota bacterium]MBU1954985.1 patatin-like phospholipase family protein [Candidatus Margulisiibacteriota bacterium]